jgi:hypothetical protein
MKHIIITRANFSNDEKFNSYFEVMKKYFIPSINSQTNKNFVLGISVNPKHFDVIRKEIDNKIEIIPFNNVKEEYKNFVVKNGFNIQTRHDCDDYMKPNYVEFIQNTIKSKGSVLGKCILTFQPIKLDFNTGKEFVHERDYSKVCSMFSTLYQKNVQDGIFDVMHDHLSRLTRNIFYFKETYVKLVIHSNNLHSKLHQTNTLIK